MDNFCRDCGRAFAEPGTPPPVSVEQREAFKARGVDIPESVCAACAVGRVTSLAGKSGGVSSAGPPSDSAPETASFSAPVAPTQHTAPALGEVQPQAASAALSSDAELTGVGGWLLVYLVLSAIAIVQSFFPSDSALVLSHVVPDFILLLGWLATIISIVSYVLIIARKKSAVMVTLVGLGMGSVISFLIGVSASHLDTASFFAGLIAAAYYVAWFLYFRKSRRVKLTLTR